MGFKRNFLNYILQGPDQTYSEQLACLNNILEEKITTYVRCQLVILVCDIAHVMQMWCSKKFMEVGWEVFPHVLFYSNLSPYLMEQGLSDDQQFQYQENSLKNYYSC